MFDRAWQRKNGPRRTFFSGARVFASLLAVLFVSHWLSVPLEAQEDQEPIAYIGHGAFFDQQGRQIVPTEEFVEQAQSWYRKRLLDRLSEKSQAEFFSFERRLQEGLRRQGQERLIVQQRALDWLMARSPLTPTEGRIQAKLNALKHFLSSTLPTHDDLSLLRDLEPFVLDKELEARLKLAEFASGGRPTRLVTTNDGQDYIDECVSHNVPIPPPIGVLDPAGLVGWRSLGFIPQSEQFIVGTPAEVRVFQNADGMCIALPRYQNSSLLQVVLDGVICLSQTTSKVCIWDNQMNGNDFIFASGDQIPIGVPDLTVDPLGRYQGGGAELEFGPGGVCTDCHAGENPYIIHPDSNLGSYLMGDLNVLPLNLPTFGPNRYDPIVGASWPQNQTSHAQALVPTACVGCHQLGGSGGRFPHLASELPGYCNTILKLAVEGRTMPTVILPTMPLGSPGSSVTDPAVVTFRNWCTSAAATGPSNRGDPHLTTVNGINFDFQAAGEFVSLRRAESGFELQSRQTPVLTTFQPGPNPHTGLASCVSLNTAAALRVGEHRISYQPGLGENHRMELRIDGRVVSLPQSGFDLGGGNAIFMTTVGEGIHINLADGSSVIITSNYWSSQGYWYLNIEVLNSPAREGILGHIFPGQWLPLGPGGTSFGPLPVSLATRHWVLNQSFADAWRVTPATSLFDYSAGTSTASFTNRDWPPRPGTSCQVISSNPWPGGKDRKPVQPLSHEEARRLCSRIEDQTVFEHCVFDVEATGNAEMADAFLLTLLARQTQVP